MHLNLIIHQTPYNVSQRVDDAEDDHDPYGESTWAELNINTPSAHNPVQREVDESAPSLPYIDDNFDHMEDTDGMTAMNILGDYLGQRNDTSGTSDSLSIQRASEDDDTKYLPDDFDRHRPFMILNKYLQPLNLLRAIQRLFSAHHRGTLA